MRPSLLPTLLLALAVAACAPDTTPDGAAGLAAAPAGTFAVPAGAGASAPRLALDEGGRPLLSWTEPDGDGHALRYAVWADTGWAAARTGDVGTGRFINWADTPGVVPLGGGRLLAHVLTMHPDGDSPYAYDVAVRLADADGRWSAPLTPHTDGTATEHGFVSAVPLGAGAGLVWLDGREMAGGHGGHGHGGGAMTIRYAAIGPDGALSDEAVLDARTCDCCPTAMVATADGPVVAYRDRSADEVRDVAVVRRVGGAWTRPHVPHADGWRIDGCPVNGPALAARGRRVALAWYTAADGAPRVHVALSDDGGAAFGPAVRVDGGAPVGRVGVALRPDGSAVVTWLEDVGGDRAEVRVRVLAPDGALGEPTTVATTASGRSSGVPHVLALGDRVLVAWTDPEAAVPVQSTVVAL